MSACLLLVDHIDTSCTAVYFFIHISYIFQRFVLYVYPAGGSNELTLKPMSPFLQQRQASMRKTKVKRPEKETATTAKDEGHDSSLSGAPSATTDHNTCVKRWEMCSEQSAGQYRKSIRKYWLYTCRCVLLAAWWRKHVIPRYYSLQSNIHVYRLRHSEYEIGPGRLITVVKHFEWKKLKVWNSHEHNYCLWIII